MTKVCERPGCRRKFEARRKDTRFCSQNCRQLAYMARKKAAEAAEPEPEVVPDVEPVPPPPPGQPDPSLGLHWDGVRATAWERWVEENLCHTRGRWHNKPFRVPPWARDPMRRIMGWVDENGLRGHRRLGLGLPKKSGKSEVAAAIGLYMLVADSESGAEVYLLASIIRQAAIVFRIAAVQAARLIGCEVRPGLNEIRHPATDSVLRVVPCDDVGQQGPSPSCVIADEVHEWPTRGREAWEALTAPQATAARQQPLVMFMTTAGRKREGVGWELWDHAVRVTADQTIDPRMVPVIHAAPEGADWRDPEVAVACNPMVGVTLTLEQIEEEIRHAAGNPRHIADYRQWRLCQWVERGSGDWLSAAAWSACGSIPPSWPPPARVKVGVGWDLGMRHDLCAAAAAWEDASGRFTDCKVWAWVPLGSMEERSKEERERIIGWIDNGWLRPVTGAVMNTDVVVSDLAAELPHGAHVCFDRWAALEAIRKLRELRPDITTTDLPQTPRAMHAGIMRTEELVRTAALRHGSNPVLTHAVNGALAAKDSRGYLHLSQARARIDAAEALVMANGALILAPEPPRDRAPLGAALTQRGRNSSGSVAQLLRS